MKPDRVSQLQIPESSKVRPQKPVWIIFLGVLVITAVAIYYAWPRPETDERRMPKGAKSADAASTKITASVTSTSAVPSNAVAPKSGDVLLTVSGYIINRERIELSPRFMGVVKWIGVKKGDTVTNNQVVVLLDDAEYKARLKETEGRLASAKANLERAQLNYDRVARLAEESIESRQMLDNMRLDVTSARAIITEIEGQIEGIRNWIDWTVIRSPIDGVVLEKLVDPNELVTPQSFGGTRGPSTALIALANTRDLQVEIDLNEADVGKVFLNQKCRVSPEAYPDKTYEGYVAEKAPEANRQKGTLQIKVQIVNPDHFLTPELSAKVDFLNESREASSPGI
ncbi:MAG: efflux RND transporter periplasmic adaptor subunit [Verrucomicrobiota bacterium]|nr:efflux RND transporter periplasmic adaptor subunit [Verrucomicrobiota bacterium]